MTDLLKLKMKKSRGGLEMNNKELVNEIIGFCVTYRLFEKSEELTAIKEAIEHQLVDVVFVEGLINRLILKAKDRKDIDFEKLKTLLLELERIRLELEYNI
jgi:hypothetical protein